MKKENLKVIILVGISGSGKSTWAINYLRRNPDTVRINRDDMRMMLTNSPVCEPMIEDMITEIQNNAIIKALSYKQNVLIDNTNLKTRYIQNIIELVKHKADVEFMIFSMPLEKCIERDSQRTQKVGEIVIKKQYEQFIELTEKFLFQKVTKTPSHENRFAFGQKNPNLLDAVAFDLDGTLALMGKRQPFDWHKVDDDDLNEIVAEHIHFHKNKGRKILIISGREESARKKTIEWLNFYEIPFDELWMRKADDFRKDSFVKEDIFKQNIEGKYNLLCVYDDRLQVLKKWYELGVFSFNVNQGNLEY
jgi:predicted kinase